MKQPSEIADILDEAAELLNRYQGAAPSTWAHNLQTLTTFAVVHQMWQESETVGELMEELLVFMTASFRMGVESVS